MIKYAEHLCRILHNFDDCTTADNTIIELNKQAKLNFFKQNLFVFHQCLYINDPRINQYKSEIQQLYDSIELHHYTNVDTLEKILNGQTLRLSQITRMNDYDEAMALIKHNMHVFYKHVCLHNCISRLSHIISTIETYAFELYTFSLSTRGDDAAQWERYGIRKNQNMVTGHSLCNICKEIMNKIKSWFVKTGNNSDSPCGVCIKIPMKKLRKKIEGLKSKYEILEIEPIAYTQDYAQNNPVLDFITKIALSRTDKEIKLIHEALSQHLGDEDTVAVFNNLPQLKTRFTYKNLIMYSSQVKHESFNSESEIRLVLRENLFEPQMSDHIMLNVGNFNDLISSIMIGPGADHIEGRVADLLKKHNLDKTVKIEKRKCSLRT